MNYQILKQGVFEEHEIKVNFDSRSLDRTSEAKEYINRQWEMAKQQNPNMFAGNLASVKDRHIDKNRIEINTLHTTYDDYFVSRTDEFLKKFPSERPANPLSVGIILVAKDKKIIFGIRSKNTSSQKNTITFPSGMVDEKDIINGNQISCFNAIKREIFEETSIIETGLRDICCIGVVWNDFYKQTYIPFFGRVEFTSNQIKRRFQEDADKEFTDMRFVPNSLASINNTLKMESISDIVNPTLEIYAKLFSRLNLG